MDPDLDLFDDILPKPAFTNARAGGKFQPTAKPRSKKVASVPISSVPPTNSNKKAGTASQTSLESTNSVQPVDITDEKLTGQIVSSSPSAPIEMMEPLKKNDEKNATEEDLSPKNPQLAELRAGNDAGLGSRFEESVIEVDSMRLDLDAFDYLDPLPAISTGRAGSKFQPKAKAQSKKRTSGLVASALPNTAVEKLAGPASTILDNMLLVESSGVEDGNLDPVGEFVFKSSETKEPGRNNEQVLLSPPEILNTISGEKELEGKSRFPRQNSVDSSAFMKCDVVASDSVCPNEATVQVDDGRLELEESGAFPDLETPGFLSPTAMESVMPPPPIAQLVPSETIIIDGSSVAAFPSDNIDDPLSTRFADFVPSDPCTSEIQINREPKYLSETSPLDNVTVIHQEDVSDAPEAETSISRKRKAAPATCSSLNSKKPFLAGDLNESDRSSRPPSKQAAVSQFGDELEDEAQGNGDFPSNNIDHDSSMHLGNFNSVDPCTSEFQVDQNQKDFTESNCSASANVVHPEDVPLVSEKESSKSGKGKASSAPNSSWKSKKTYLASDVNEGKKSSRQLRKRAAGRQVDEPEDEAHDTDGSPAGPPSSSVDEEDNDYEPRGDDESDDEYRVETTSRKKRASKKSKEPVAEKEKPVRKRKRSNDTPEQSTQEPRKKFSHSTRRNRRSVNKDLLNTPEDEIDFKRLPIRDIILFAEYKEKLAMKEATASKTPPNKQSSDYPFHREYSYNEEDGFASEQDRTYDDDQTYVRAQPSSSLFNHQSFMDRAPNSRWSKQDTELFYEGIRQFGTDLSMIQQLFPGRTRHQVKLKYKKEERQHPLRLHEALSSRPKDHSYFEKLIEQLQEVAATQEQQESYKDDILDVSGEEDAELNAGTNDEGTKAKQDEDIGVEDDQEENIAEEHHGPHKSGASDEEVDIWSSYRSEF